MDALLTMMAGSPARNGILERDEGSDPQLIQRRNLGGTEVGVVGRLAEPGEVLDHRDDAAVLQSASKRQPVGGGTSLGSG